MRLLLDDLNTRGLDPSIAALDAHPNIEVRLYNPFVQRDARAFNFLTRVNRRMHNKSFTSAVHAKTFAVDRNRIFVGSFNFDQRSALLNTEMGFVIQGPKLAQRLAAFFDAEVPMAAYEVRLTADGRDLEWIQQTSSGTKRYDTDPGTSWFLRREVDFLSILPIEGVTLAGDSLMLGRIDYSVRTLQLAFDLDTQCAEGRYHVTGML